MTGEKSTLELTDIGMVSDITEGGARADRDSFTHRLLTYDQRWAGQKDREDMARAGFRYAGIGDKVECEQCGLKLLNWTSTDDPLHEHATRRPLCPFINSRYRQLGQTKPPKHPKYQQLQDRLDSFTSWPTQFVPKTPDELTAAGFFYIGSADRVTCFQCGITLRDWEEEHDPVTEHQRYSENCQFINKTDLDQLGVATRSTGIETDDLGTNKTESACAIPTASSLEHKQVVSANEKADKISCHGTENKDPSTLDSKLSLGSTIFPTATKAQTTSNEISETTTTGFARMSLANNSNKRRLTEENKRLREKSTCKVCQENGVGILFLPCGHLVTCADCAPKVSECIVCKKTILGTVKTFFT